MVRTEDACEIIKYALQNEIKVYLDGGWGVDALLKRESRIHNDIDFRALEDIERARLSLRQNMRIQAVQIYTMAMRSQEL